MRVYISGIVLGILLFLSALLIWSQRPNYSILDLFDEEALQTAIDSGQTNFLILLTGVSLFWVVLFFLSDSADQESYYRVFFIFGAVGILYSVFNLDWLIFPAFLIGFIGIAFSISFGVIFGVLGFLLFVIYSIAPPRRNSGNRQLSEKTQAMSIALGIFAFLFIITLLFFSPSGSEPLPPIEATIIAMENDIATQQSQLTQTPIAATQQANQTATQAALNAQETATASAQQQTLTSLSITQTALAAVAQGDTPLPLPRIITQTPVPQESKTQTPTPEPNTAQETLVALQNQQATLEATAGFTPIPAGVGFEPIPESETESDQGTSFGEAFLDFLRDPAMQGVGVIIALIGLGVAVLQLRRS